MADLQMTHMAKNFGPSQVFKDFSLSIEDGEFLVLVGPSGCGKSTLLRMIAGLEPITEGDMLIGGKRVNNVPPQKRGISMVFQSYALFPHMSVHGNIAFGPRVRGEDRESVEGGIQRASEILGLDQYIDRKPAQLSGGQRQRVATGRSIVRDPQVFLFDEPLSNLDAKLRVQMRTEIKALHQKLGTTIVYVTHDQIEAMTMADRIVVMNEGRTEQIGTPLELYDRPTNVFVGGFIGSPSMSFLDGRYEKSDDSGGAVMLDDETVLPVSAVEANDGCRLKIGIRPEAYARDENGPIALTVEVVEPTGPEIHISGTVAGAAIRAVFRERILPAPGETIRVSVQADQIHLFDAENGHRLGP